MNVDVILNASPAIQFHVYAAILAFFVGAFVLWQRKGTASHKRLGKLWVVLMVVTALTSLFIHEIRLIGAFSPIHLISIGTLVSLFFAVKQAREGDIRNHQRSMKATYIGGMGIAGAMSFTPGRRMYEALIEPTISKFSSGNIESVSLFDGSWQLPILSVAVLVIIVFRKPVLSFLSFK